jgi:flagellar hook-associated protein 3 FlgL
MRVTDSMTFDQAKQNIEAAQARQNAASQATSTGLRVTHPGDDPGAAGLIAANTLASAQYDAIGTAVGRASDELNAADSAMSDLSNTLTRAKEIATQLSNSTYSASDRAAAATEVAGLLQSAVASGNTQVNNRYIFGGTADSSPPFDATGNYSGNDQDRQIEIAPNVLQTVSVNADTAFKGAGGGTDMFAALSGLQTALSTNDVAGIQASLTTIDASISQVSVARSKAGGAASVLEASTSANSLGKLTATTAISHLGDADAVGATTELAAAQNALNATLTATAEDFQLSLVNKLPISS